MCTCRSSSESGVTLTLPVLTVVSLYVFKRAGFTRIKLLVI